jgi:hypothetical protein
MSLDYSVCAWNEGHSFSLVGKELNYRFDKSGVRFAIDLSKGIASIRRHKQTHRFLRAGLPMVLIPIVVAAQIYMKEGVVYSTEPQFLLLYLLFVVGVIMLIRYRTIYQACTVITKAGDEILVLCDQKKPEEFNRFVAVLERIRAEQTV